MTSTTSSTNIQLPSLPEPSGYYSNFYGEEDMQSYAIASIEADRKNTMELLRNPVHVHSNMCRGIIAPITFDMLAHILGEDETNEWLHKQYTRYNQATMLWQPIETAPKDNKRPLYLAKFSDGELIELDFNGSWEYWSESWELSHINGYCWFSENGIEEPTHWAYQDEPLPTTQSSAIQNLLSAALEILKSADRNGQIQLDESGALASELRNAVKQIDD